MKYKRTPFSYMGNKFRFIDEIFSEIDKDNGEWKERNEYFYIIE